MSKSQSLQQKRLAAIYKFKDYSDSSKQKEMLEFFLASCSHKLIKEAIDYFNIKI